MATGRRDIIAGAGAAALSGVLARRARAVPPSLKLACLTDMNGPSSDVTGQGSLASMRIAIEDFHALHPNIPVELVSADYGLKVDTGISILRSWLDNDGVDAVFDFPTSAMAIAATGVCEEKNKAAFITAAVTSDLTRTRCGPNHVHFSSDTFSLATSLVKDIVRQGGTSWYFIVPNYEFGKAGLADASRAAQESGGTVVGSVTYPYPTTTDFSSLLLQAQSSGAKVLCLLNGADDLTNAAKQAEEFGITRSGLVFAPTFLDEYNIVHLGLGIVGNYFYNSPFYLDRNDGTRAFSKRLMAALPSAIPMKTNASLYSATFHYLKTAAEMGVPAAKADGRAAIRAMKARPVQDMVYGTSSIRQDGVVVRDMLLMKVKTPDQSKARLDFASVVSVTPGDISAHPLDPGCKLVRN